MIKENANGSNEFSSRNDGYAHSKLTTPAFSSPEDSGSRHHASATAGEVAGLDIHHSSPRLDAYLFYFSSKL